MSVDFLASSDDERGPGLTQSDEERIGRLCSPEQAYDDETGTVALQPERELAGNTEKTQTAATEEADRAGRAQAAATVSKPNEARPGQALTLELAALGTGPLPRGRL